jgi:hypothetical protein
MGEKFCLNEPEWRANGPLLPRTSPEQEGPRSRSKNWLSLAGLPGRLRAADHDLQSASPLDSACAAYGGRHSQRWPASTPAIIKPSTAGVAISATLES